MLKMPVFTKRAKIMEYYFCMGCIPHRRKMIRCSWRTTATITSPFEKEPAKFYWCTKMDEPCNTESEPCGYQRCPQIREWEEESCPWTKIQNREFEEKEREETKKHFEKCLKIYKGTKEHGNP